MSEQSFSFRALINDLKQYRFHLPALLVTAVAGIFFALLGSFVYTLLGGGFLSGALATLSVIVPCALCLWCMERIRPHIAPAANPQLIGILLLISMLLISTVAGLFNLNGHSRTIGRNSLVLLVDKSGSMDDYGRDAACMNSLSTLLDGLSNTQQLIVISFGDDAVFYGGSATLVVNSPDNRAAILTWLRDIPASSSSTNGDKALDAAIRYAPTGSTILMITDSGIHNASELQRRTSALTDKGLIFSCLHIGNDSDRSSELASLTDDTGGTYAMTADLDMLDTLMFEAVSVTAGDLYAPVDGFSELRLIKLTALGLLLGLTYFFAFGFTKGVFLPVLTFPLLAAGIYLLLCFLPLQLPPTLYPLPMLFAYAPLFCFFRQRRQAALPPAARRQIVIE